jgi:hypothetical protein
MENKNLRIWIWLQDNELHKAVYNPTSNCLIICNQHDEIILKRTGITPEQLTQLEVLFLRLGAKRMDDHNQPFTYL